MTQKKLLTEAEVQAILTDLRSFNERGLAAIARLTEAADDLTLRVADLEAFRRTLQAMGN
jgi:hypothetical protein